MSNYRIYQYAGNASFRKPPRKLKRLHNSFSDAMRALNLFSALKKSSAAMMGNEVKLHQYSIIYFDDKGGSEIILTQKA